MPPGEAGLQKGNARYGGYVHLVAIAATLLATACGGSASLTVRPVTASPPELIPAAPLSKHAYRRVLVLPPEAVELKDVDIASVAEKSPAYYSGAIEKALLAAGFEVISAEIVARADSKQGAPGMSAAEKAMVLGKQSKADAVLVLQEVSVRKRANFYAIQDLATKQIDAARVKLDDDGLPYDADTEACLHRVPFYELRLQAKLLDARSGTLLWVGSGSQSTIEVIKDDWVAEVDGDCDVQSQNFVYEDFMAEESTLDLVVRTLLGRVIKPMAEPALAGASLEAPKPAPPVAVAKPAPEVKKRMAVVSTKRASLRKGPGKRKRRVMRVPRKAKVEVLETMGEWNRVRVQDGTEGWMHEDTLILDP